MIVGLTLGMGKNREDGREDYLPQFIAEKYNFPFNIVNMSSPGVTTILFLSPFLKVILRSFLFME